MADNSYTEMWERIRRRIEDLLIEESDRAELDQISKLLERAQKGELALRGEDLDDLMVVNIHIPGVCDSTTSPHIPKTLP